VAICIGFDELREFDFYFWLMRCMHVSTELCFHVVDGKNL